MREQTRDSLAGAEPLAPPPARLQRWEIVAVFAVSLGASGLYALVNLIGSLTAKQALSKQTAVLNGSMAPGRPLLDLTLQLLSVTLSLAPVLLVFYLLARAGEGPSAIGVDAREPGRDLARGAALAAVIGGSASGSAPARESVVCSVIVLVVSPNRGSRIARSPAGG